MRHTVSILTILLCACGGGDPLRGQVVDIWGNPIEGATVKIVGQSERPLTDGNGWFNLPKTDGTISVKAGREGYIEDELSLDVNEKSTPPVIRLYPRPEKAGFWVVGSAVYVPLAPETVKAFGNEIKTLYGIKTLGEASVDGSELKLIYHTDLRLDQVMTLEPQIHKLAFQRDAKLVGALSTEVRVNLWVSDTPLKTTITPLKSRTDYLLEAEGTLEPGGYALTTNNLLNPATDEAFDKIAAPLRIIFPMELR